jgi:hypothetical protein
MTTYLREDLPQLLERLVSLTRAWSTGAAFDDEADGVLRAAVRAAHARYASVIPVYRRLAQSQTHDNPDVDDIVRDLMLSSDVFKSYQPSWLQASQFDRMTEWLSGRFSRAIDIRSDSLTSIADWRQALRDDGVFLASSSGTSGRWSFVPRDERTVRALARNGSAYHHRVWSKSETGDYGEFDCLILAPRGKGLGLQAAGTGLARMGRRSHHLLDDADSRASGASYARAVGFLGESARTDTRVIIFGAPFQIADLCEHVRTAGLRVRVPADSLVVSGGGWKSFEGRRISRPQLQNLIEGTLGVAGDRIIDTYSTAELNCVFMTCSYGKYHVPPLLAPVVLDRTLAGSWGSEGSGILGALDPFAWSYPGFIITGDLVTLARGRCDCGLDGWMIVGEITRAAGEEIRGCGGVITSLMA